MDSKRNDVPSVYHAQCEVLIHCSDCTNERCSSCAKYRKSLSAMVSRTSMLTDDRTCPNSHTTHTNLTSVEKSEWLRRLHHEKRMCQQQVRRLCERNDESTATEGVCLDEELHSDFLQVMNDNNKEIHSSHEEGTFQRLFWDQQRTASSLRNGKSMRWHPLLIKWCLYLRHLSGKAYDLLRDSGCIHLPSQRTLRDYTHYIKSQVGFSNEVHQAVVDAANLSDNLNKYVIIVMDEIYIKNDMVYDKHEGSLIGFVNIGDTNNQILEFEAIINTGEPGTSLAISMMVIMVRGLLHRLDYTYAQFACGKLSGDLMFDPIWEAVERLERIGFFVLGLCCDGASANSKLWKLHSESKELMYRVPNIILCCGR